MKKYIIFLLFLFILLPTAPKRSPEATNDSWKTRLSSWWHKLSPEKKATLAGTANKNAVPTPEEFFQSYKVLENITSNEAYAALKDMFDNSIAIIMIKSLNNAKLIVQTRANQLKGYLVTNQQDVQTVENQIKIHKVLNGKENILIVSKDQLFLNNITEALNNGQKVLLTINGENTETPGKLRLYIEDKSLKREEAIALWYWLKYRMQLSPTEKQKITIPAQLPSSLFVSYIPTTAFDKIKLKEMLAHNPTLKVLPLLNDPYKKNSPYNFILVEEKINGKNSIKRYFFSIEPADFIREFNKKEYPNVFLDKTDSTNIKPYDDTSLPIDDANETTLDLNGTIQVNKHRGNHYKITIKNKAYITEDLDMNSDEKKAFDFYLDYLTQLNPYFKKQIRRS